ncbi:MAG: TlpA family protein disulfide reductase [Bacteroidales bacterium]|nr:TlpA family protein disulfide reductase [Bacteroidales bacterium]
MKRQSLLKYFLLISLVILCAQGFSQPVTVTGSAIGAEGRTIRLITWSDLITFTEETVAETVIDSIGNFSMTFDLPVTSYIAVAIDLHRSNLYMQPGQSYEMKLAPINYADNLEVNPFIRSQNLEIELINPGDNELNIWINAYDDKYNQFLLDHFNALYLERKKNYIDTFRLQVNGWYHGIDQPYFQDYMRYKTAGLEQIAHAKSEYTLAKNYFINQPVLYNNVEYMQFFDNYFTKYLTATSNILRKIDLDPIIKGPDPYHKLMTTLATDSVLINVELRELVLMQGLFELFYSNQELQDPIISVFTAISQESQTERNRLIALNLKAKVTKLRKGTPAPEFTLIGRQKDKSHSLKDFLGKPVVLNFWTTFCQGCLAEMELEVPLYQKYKDQVAFISICADRYWIKMNYFVMIKPEFAWTMLHFSDNTDLLKNYEVTTYPLYVVIDKDGNIVQAPAPNLSDGLERVIEDLIH